MDWMDKYGVAIGYAVVAVGAGLVFMAATLLGNGGSLVNWITVVLGSIVIFNGYGIAYKTRDLRKLNKILEGYKDE